MAKRCNTDIALSRLWKNCERFQVDIRDLKMIVFSDHHRGRRDGADDFVQCEETYLHALRDYYDEGFHLCLLGDVEELWENNPLQCIRAYPKSIAQESLFHKDERFTRIWGNHDDLWKQNLILRQFFPKSFPKIKSYEGIILDIEEDGSEIGQIFLAHGHQGSLASDRWALISKFFVRVFWRNIQRLFKKKLSTASSDLHLRTLTDHEVYDWTSQQARRITIIGHTHQPVFMSLTLLDRLDEVAETTGSPEVKEKIKSMEVEQKATRLNKIKSKRNKPCYFNTGCCSFSDGDITGIEFNDGKISLVKWSSVTFKKTVLEAEPLKTVFDKTLEE